MEKSRLSLSLPHPAKRDTKNNFRAYADVHLTDPSTGVRSPTFQCLVDTGSDYTILPISAATAIGLTPSGPPVTFRSVGGVAYTLPSHSAVYIEIQGYLTIGTVVFSTAAGFSPIIGRLELIQAFDIGMDASNWYYD